MGTTQTYIDLARLAYTTDTNTAQDGNYGDLPDAWASIPNTVIHVLDSLLDLTNGQLLVGKSGAAVQKVTVNGDANMTETGLLTLNAGAVTPTKMSVNGKINTGFGYGSVNPSAAVTDLAFYFDRAATIVAAKLFFYSATGATAANISVGKPGNTSYFVAPTANTTSAAAFTPQDLTLANTTIAANDIITFTSAGGGSSANILLWMAWYYND